MKIIFGVFGFLFTLAFGLLGVLFTIGGIYWLWVAIQIGSFAMFVVGLIPPAWFITSVVGAYSLVFGVPDWVFRWFG